MCADCPKVPLSERHGRRNSGEPVGQEKPVNEKYRPALAVIFVAVGVAAASGQTNDTEAGKIAQCETYARNAVASTPGSTGPVRGAARGAILGGAFGNAGAGAATGAVIGTARRANQRSRAYQDNYNSCM